MFASAAVLAPLVLAFVVSLLTSLIIVATRGFHGRHTLDSHGGIQKIHEFPAPRVGGLGLAFGAIAGGTMLPDAAQALWWMICLAAVPAFLAGLTEDITKRVSVRSRLAATILSGAIFSLVTGYTISHIGFGPIDVVLGVAVVSVLFSSFAIGGIANAFNIIDGCHGLASGTAVILLGAFGMIAYHAGDGDLVRVIAMSAAVLVGFLLVNFPMGKLFLGDAGAYSVGFLLAAIAIALPARNPQVSPVIGLLVLSYPVMETFYSIWRRSRIKGSAVGQPDRLHLHSLMFQAMTVRIKAAALRNPMSSVVLWSLPLLSAVFGDLFARSSLTDELALTFTVFFAYYGVYRAVSLVTQASVVAEVNPIVSGEEHLARDQAPPQKTTARGDSDLEPQRIKRDR
jgi:UDP-N-acetylmuramyl pentapeptide phosphotransferase/UDP-N-acetylglucosamine-1-phosphate transferase